MYNCPCCATHLLYRSNTFSKIFACFQEFQLTKYISFTLGELLQKSKRGTKKSSRLFNRPFTMNSSEGILKENTLFCFYKKISKEKDTIFILVRLTTMTTWTTTFKTKATGRPCPQQCQPSPLRMHWIWNPSPNTSARVEYGKHLCVPEINASTKVSELVPIVHWRGLTYEKCCTSRVSPWQRRFSRSPPCRAS